MAALTPGVRADARRALSRVVCLGCNKAKPAGHVFCRPCFWKLTPGQQKALYTFHESEAFAEAFAGALTTLRPRAIVYELT
ncbi:MAG TPA: hypothetical protein VGX48_18750 [Pyrinomonadaceae bacterium]|jgi:hypothetical protein|nr:hypothetical protein [Pyrinomonadaceae bacterium]